MTSEGIANHESPFAIIKFASSKRVKMRLQVGKCYIIITLLRIKLSIDMIIDPHNNFTSTDTPFQSVKENLSQWS